MTSLPTTRTSQVAVLSRPEAGLARAGGAASSAGMSFGQIVAILKRHVWLIATLFVVVQLIAWGSFFVCDRFAREYTAGGQMQLVNEPSLWVSDAGTLNKFNVESRQREEAMRLMSSGNISSFLQDPQTKRLDWVLAHQNDPEPLDSQMRRRLSSSPVRDSTFIQVAFSDSNPKAAAELVNAFMRFYETLSSSQALRRHMDTLEAIQRKLDAFRTDWNAKDNEIKSIVQTEGFESLEISSGEARSRLNQISSLYTQARTQLNSASDAMEKLQQQYADPTAEPSEAIKAQVDANLVIQNLEARRRALLEERTVLLQTLGPKHRRIIEIDTRIDEVDATIRDKRAELTLQAKAQALSAAQAAVQALRVQLDSLGKDLETARNVWHDMQSRWMRYRSLLDERKEIEGKMEKLDARILEIRMEIDRGVPQTRASIQAAPPERVSFPRWQVFMAGGLVLGLGLGVGLAFLVELSDSSVRTPRDLSEQVRLPLLGFVPLVEENLPAEQVARLAAAQPLSMFAECFRQVRTNLLFAAPVDQLNSILITSAARDEGKTTVAANLAITIALSGRRVLLIDANFRRPLAARIFGLPNEVGLSNVLTNQATLPEAAAATEIPNLTVLPTGPLPPNPAELLGSATMRSLLDAATAEYDLVLFDGPPALLVNDTMTLATMVSGVLTVVRAGETGRGMVNRLRDQLGRVNAHIVGAVLNAARPTRGGYFRKSFEEYEAYQASASQSQGEQAS